MIERAGDLAAMLTNLEEREVLFIDEIHRMAPAIEEILYPAMEDFELDIMIGQGPSARSVKVPVKPFTLIGATTRAGLLTSPLRARFGIVQRLDFYTAADLEEIVRRSARILGVDLELDAARELARRARGTPRVANRLLRRVRDFAEVRADGRITLEVAHAALRLLEVDERGFDDLDRRLLRTIIDKYGGGPVGLNSLAASIGEDAEALEDIYEPYLMQIGFLDRTPRGRVATARAYRVLWPGPTEPRGQAVVMGDSDVTTRAVESGRLSRPGLRRVTVAGLATYVPPRVLTNADLEKMVETSDEWIQQRTGIRERHIVDPGVATSDLAKAGSAGGHRAGRHHAGRHRLHRRRHDHARHDVSEHGLPAATQDRRDQGLGIRPGRGLLGFHLCADHGRAPGRRRHGRARAGRRRRRDVEHPRLHRPHDLRAVRRRGRRGGRLAVDGSRRSASSTSRRRLTAAAGTRSSCRPAGACDLPRRRPSSSVCTS